MKINDNDRPVDLAASRKEVAQELIVLIKTYQDHCESLLAQVKRMKELIQNLDDMVD